MPRGRGVRRVRGRTAPYPRVTVPQSTSLTQSESGTIGPAATPAVVADLSLDQFVASCHKCRQSSSTSATSSMASTALLSEPTGARTTTVASQVGSMPLLATPNPSSQGIV